MSGRSDIISGMSHAPLEPAQLLAVVDDQASVEDLRSYFGLGLVAGSSPPFTGGRFEALGEGGDRPGVADGITAEDLVAVQMLSVRVPAEVALELLEGQLGEEVAAELTEIPTDVDLGTPDAARLLADGGPADRAWHLLDSEDEVSWTIAGKLLARKRPRLVPVYDRVVRCALGRPSDAWLWLNERFENDDRALPRQLTAVQAEAGVPEYVTPPRVLDVILWMRHHRSHQPSRCRRTEFAQL